MFFDTKMTFYNSGLSQIDSSDNKSTVDLFSIITYTATYTGTYYIKVEGYQPSTKGEYYFYYYR